MTTTDPTQHRKGENAEDCPACAPTNPPYPWICPGDDRYRVTRTPDTLTGPTSTDAQPQMHNGLSMSLAEQIAREHYLTTRGKCACPDAIDAGRDAHAWVAHIATVTERAVRERMRAAGPTLEIHAWGATPEQADTIFTAAMDAAWDAAPEGVAVDAVGKLAGKATRGATDG